MPVTYDGFCDLIRRSIASAPIAHGLCQQLQKAKAAAARGAAKTKRKAIAEFMKHVKKLKGRHLTPAQVEMLVRMSQAL